MCNLVFFFCKQLCKCCVSSHVLESKHYCNVILRLMCERSAAVQNKCIFCRSMKNAGTRRLTKNKSNMNVLKPDG